MLMRVVFLVICSAMLVVVGCQSPQPTVPAAQPPLPQKTAVTTPEGVTITPYQPEEIQRQKL